MSALALCALLVAGDPPQTAGPKAAEPNAAVQVKQPPAAEYTLAVNEGSASLRVTLKPGEPQPGELVEVLIDIARKPESTDPTYGDRVPVGGALFEVAMTGPGASERRRLWPVGDAGVYGAHWTPTTRGLWTFQLAPLDAKGEGVRASFQVGVGVPQPASSEGQAVRTARVVMAGQVVVAGGRPTARSIMHELGRRWLQLGKPGADDKAELAAISALADKLPGTVPQKQAAEFAEYDFLAADLKAALATPESRAAAEQGVCLKCHVKFRDGVVSELAGWPEVKPWKK